MTPDQAVFQFIQSRLQIPLLQYVCRDLTSVGGNFWVPSITVLVACILGVAGEWRTAGAIGIAVAFAGLVVYLLKVLIGRPCPLSPDPYQHKEVARHLCEHTAIIAGPSFPVPHLPCFPSGHTCASTFLYGLLAVLASRSWPDFRGLFCAVGLGLPVAVGATRVILSAHWMTDVIGGWALGNILLGGWRLWLT